MIVKVESSMGCHQIHRENEVVVMEDSGGGSLMMKQVVFGFFLFLKFFKNNLNLNLNFKVNMSVESSCQKIIHMANFE